MPRHHFRCRGKNKCKNQFRNMPSFRKEQLGFEQEEIRQQLLKIQNNFNASRLNSHHIQSNTRLFLRIHKLKEAPLIHKEMINISSFPADAQIKAVIYSYLVNHRHLEMSLMCLNSIESDLKNPELEIRALALRTLLAFEQFSDRFTPALLYAVRDDSLRNHALHLTRKHSIQIPFPESDTDAAVLVNVLYEKARLGNVDEKSVKPLLFRVLASLYELDKLSLKLLCDALMNITLNDSDKLAVMNILDPLLSSTEAWLVMKACDLFRTLSPVPIEDVLVDRLLDAFENSRGEQAAWLLKKIKTLLTDSYQVRQRVLQSVRLFLRFASGDVPSEAIELLVVCSSRDYAASMRLLRKLLRHEKLQTVTSAIEGILALLEKSDLDKVATTLRTVLSSLSPKTTPAALGVILDRVCAFVILKQVHDAVEWLLKSFTQPALHSKQASTALTFLVGQYAHIDHAEAYLALLRPKASHRALEWAATRLFLVKDIFLGIPFGRHQILVNRDKKAAIDRMSF